LISSVRLVATQSIILHGIPLPSAILDTVASLSRAGTVLHSLLMHHSILITHASLRTVHPGLHPLPLSQAALIVESRLIIAGTIPVAGLLHEAVLESSTTVPVAILVLHLPLLHTPSLVTGAVGTGGLPSSHSPLPTATASRCFSCGETQAYNDNSADCQ
jgi:hypothetical protein